MRKILLFLASITLLLFTPNSYSKDSPHRPKLIIKTFDHGTWNLSEKKGELVLVNFWASWCPECRREMRILNEIHDEYKARGLEIIGISIDSKRGLKESRRVVKDVGYPTGMFFEIESGNFKYPATIPITYLIDKNGELYHIFDAEDAGTSKSDFKAVLDSLI